MHSDESFTVSLQKTRNCIKEMGSIMISCWLQLGAHFENILKMVITKCTMLSLVSGKTIKTLKTLRQNHHIFTASLLVLILTEPLTLDATHLKHFK